MSDRSDQFTVRVAKIAADMDAAGELSNLAIAVAGACGGQAGQNLLDDFADKPAPKKAAAKKTRKRAKK